MNAPAAPLFTVTRGAPTDTELAALAAVLVALPPGDRPDPPAATIAGGWRSLRHGIRTPLPPGPSAWRSTFRG